MEELDYFWVEFGSLRIKAKNRAQVFDIVLGRLDEGNYPEIYVEQEFRMPLRACPVHDQKIS